MNYITKAVPSGIVRVNRCFERMGRLTGVTTGRFISGGMVFAVNRQDNVPVYFFIKPRIVEALKWIRKHYNLIVNSIAFYPAIISGAFLLLSIGTIYFDFSHYGRQLKSHVSWITLQDASTARNVVSSIAAGVISLTVFSFSMVMIVLNQAASQMSNRVLNIMIGNRFQQVVLGFYIGTIVYALFLLSTIRDVQSGIYIPAISIYLLVLLMIIDIFLFIYFLHYVTQTVKYETIIRIIKDKTIKALENQHHEQIEYKSNDQLQPATNISANETGYFQDYDEKKLVAFAKEHNIVIEFLFSKGTYFIKGAEMLVVHGSPLSDEQMEEMFLLIDFYEGQTIDVNPYYGFQQLSEVGVKALSPGINDGATAVSAIHALAHLLGYYIKHPTCCYICDTADDVWLITKEKTFEDLFCEYVLPVWHYGKDDPFVQHALNAALLQLQQIDEAGVHTTTLRKMLKVVDEKKQANKIL